ncbi:MAG TPA: hypothetical protein VK864_17255 [Longimicrobiales bacterium]|nr:hypothetical protein [Longimicrobiales bacterium]
MELDASHPDQLVLEGWSRRFISGPARVKEYVAFYESLGFDVRLEPVATDELPEMCNDCALALHFFRAIYTRRRQ